ncbi:hypothetical protein OIU74_011804 [Salix koriyanagi]|uniref:Uncharacterized protein n=1 Tax=Salix koriyanagi TaxID=2511006 RepID=A0A9Q0YUW3_9ROSI|nr:hypothetical protein OIU74_011804 [Salix koriyanagi]
MTMVVAADADAGFLSSTDSGPTPTMTLWASKWKGWPTQAEGVANTSMKATENKPTGASKKTCICAPTSHAGSFRCQLHRTTTTAQNSEEGDSDKESNEDLDFMKMILCRKFSTKKPQLSRFGRAAALAVNNA